MECTVQEKYGNNKENKDKTIPDNETTRFFLHESCWTIKNQHGKELGWPTFSSYLGLFITLQFVLKELKRYLS